ncbi:MAG: phytoene/squalene synthase family protein [Polyangia bacterium]
MTRQQQALTQAILAHHSKSFALAGKLLPAWCRYDAAVLYAWCRRCDDAVDFADEGQASMKTSMEAPTEERGAAVVRLRDELSTIYAGNPQSDPVLAAFQELVSRHQIPRVYADELLAGMSMDVGVVRYRTFAELLLYCYRAAGTVGLMMAHVMKVKDPPALRRAADLGIAMQLTNICRDVAEDERRGRVYLPAELQGSDAGLLPSQHPQSTAAAVAELLRRADLFYRSGDVGLRRLPWRCGLAIRAARFIYAEIGAVIARRGFDVLAGRAVVPRMRKAWLVLRALIQTLGAQVVTP